MDWKVGSNIYPNQEHYTSYTETKAAFARSVLIINSHLLDSSVNFELETHHCVKSGFSQVFHSAFLSRVEYCCVVTESKGEGFFPGLCYHLPTEVPFVTEFCLYWLQPPLCSYSPVKLPLKEKRSKKERTIIRERCYKDAWFETEISSICRSENVPTSEFLQTDVEPAEPSGGLCCAKSWRAHPNAVYLLNSQLPQLPKRLWYSYPPPPSTTRELDIGSDACVQFLTHVRTIRRVLISHGRGGGRGLLPESLCRGLKSVFFSPSESYQPHITAGLLLFLQKAWLKCKALKQLVPVRSSSFLSSDICVRPHPELKVWTLFCHWSTWAYLRLWFLFASGDTNTQRTEPFFFWWVLSDLSELCYSFWAVLRCAFVCAHVEVLSSVAWECELD